MRSVFTGIAISLLALGCTIHEPTYYTVYSPERHSTNAGANIYAANGQMNLTSQINLNGTNSPLTASNLDTGAARQGTNQPPPPTGRINYAGSIYTEGPNTATGSTPSNSTNRNYPLPGTFPQSLAEGGAPSKETLADLDTTWNPVDQGVTGEDRAIIRQIRRTWGQNYDLSVIAAGLKIVADHGKVTISGPVDNQRDKEKLASLAKTTAGVVGVQDQLAVRPGQ